MPSMSDSEKPKLPHEQSKMPLFEARRVMALEFGETAVRDEVEAVPVMEMEEILAQYSQAGDKTDSTK